LQGRLFEELASSNKEKVYEKTIWFFRMKRG